MSFSFLTMPLHGRNAHQSFFIVANASWSTFFLFFHENPPKSSFLIQNSNLFKLKGRVCAALKTFLVDTMSHSMLSGSCLGPRLSNKANGVVIRHTNPFLWPQTQGLSDFFVFVPSQIGFQAKSYWYERFWVFF